MNWGWGAPSQKRALCQKLICIQYQRKGDKIKFKLPTTNTTYYIIQHVANLSTCFPLEYLEAEFPARFNTIYGGLWFTSFTTHVRRNLLDPRPYMAGDHWILLRPAGLQRLPLGRKECFWLSPALFAAQEYSRILQRRKSISVSAAMCCTSIRSTLGGSASVRPPTPTGSSSSNKS